MLVLSTELKEGRFDEFIRQQDAADVAEAAFLGAAPTALFCV
jgi:hypothetical protein